MMKLKKIKHKDEQSQIQDMFTTTTTTRSTSEEQDRGGIQYCPRC